MAEILIAGENCRIAKAVDLCSCTDVDLEDLIIQSKVAEVELSKSLVSGLFHGWMADENAAEKIEDLQHYRKIIEREYRRIQLGGEGCLTCEERQLLFEKINILSYACDRDMRPDLIVDDSNLEIWMILNPYCIAREKWEYLLYDVACNLELEVTICNKKEICNITFDIIKKDIPCDIAMAVSICNKKCDLEMEVTATACKACDVEFDIMVGESSCISGMQLQSQKIGEPLTLDMYKSLVDKNISPAVIKTVYANNSFLEIENDEVVLHSQTGKHLLKNIKFVEDPNIEVLSKYTDISDSEYVKDPETFVNKINREYSGN